MPVKHNYRHAALITKSAWNRHWYLLILAVQQCLINWATYATGDYRTLTGNWTSWDNWYCPHAPQTCMQNRVLYFDRSMASQLLCTSGSCLLFYLIYLDRFIITTTKTFSFFLVFIVSCSLVFIRSCFLLCILLHFLIFANCILQHFNHSIHGLQSTSNPQTQCCL